MFAITCDLTGTTAYAGCACPPGHDPVQAGQHHDECQLSDLHAMLDCTSRCCTDDHDDHEPKSCPTEHLKLGYNPDTLLMTDDLWAVFMSDDKVTNALRRETTDNPVYTGTIERFAGLVILHSPQAPANPMVLDSVQLGGMADEASSGPGYAVSDLAVQVKSIRKDEADKWTLQGRRLTVPVIQEPGSACSITGT
jgi:hypothetical protein